MTTVDETSGRGRAGIGLCLAGLMGLQAGCTLETAQIVRAPLVSPIVTVSVDSSSFRLKVAVRNYNESTPSQPLRLTVQLKTTQDRDCFALERFPIGVLQPLKEWQFTKILGDMTPGCGCVKDACTGFVILRLENTNGGSLPGPNTNLEVTWTKDADPSGIAVKELGT